MSSNLIFSQKIYCLQNNNIEAVKYACSKQCILSRINNNTLFMYFENIPTTTF